MGGLGFREAASLWGVAADPELAFPLHALVGGAAEEKAGRGGAGPGSRAELDRWVERWLLSPDSAMQGQGDRVMRTGQTAAATELTALIDVICAGNARPGPIGAALGWPSGQVDRVLAELARRGVVERLADPLGGEPACVIVAPIVRLHRLVIAPAATALAAGQAERVWAGSRATVEGLIYRPHFASLARQWSLRHAAESTVGGVARAARPVAIGCPEHHAGHELDALVVEDPAASGRVLAIGEANASDQPMAEGSLRWLEHLRALLPADRVGPAPALRLLLFSRSGFAPTLRAEATARSDVELVGLDRMYGGA